MRIFVLLALVPAVLCQLEPEDQPRPSVKGFSTIAGVCDIAAGTISGAAFAGREGTLKACTQKCTDNANCKGLNFVTDQNQCQLFRQECTDTRKVARTEAKQNFYLKGEIACSTSTVGNEFYLAFMANRVAQPKNMDLEIWVTQDKSLTNTTVQVSYDPSQSLEKNTISVPYKQAVLYKIPYTWKVSDVDSGVTIEKKALKLSSDTDFVFYGVNKEYFTADAFLGIPSRALGTRYVANCHWPPFYNCEFAITSTSADTVVTVTLPKTPARNVGNWAKAPTGNTVCNVPYKGRSYTNGDTFRITLQEFEVAQIQDPCDLTGTVIESDKPIAVWSGDSRVNIGDSPSRDHQVEELFSTDTWGTDCAAWPTPNRVEGLVDYWVITAAEPNTAVLVESNEKGPVTYNLNAGESVRFPANSVREMQRFSSRKKFQAAKYASSAVDNSIPGDPSMTLCIPTDQFGFGYTFVTPTGVSSTYTNYLSIITTKTATNGFTLDGQPVTGITWADFPNSNLVAGFVKLDSRKQQFRIEHRVKGTTFEAYIYGAGDRESVAYPTGACIKALGECVPSTMFIADGKDNDCDGVIDEELFDGIDNDFDGKIDEDCYERKPVAQDRCPEVKTAQACYNGHLSLGCSDGTIKIVSAHYGRMSRRGEKTCGAENVLDSCAHGDLGCGYTDISPILAIACEGQTSCNAPVNQFAKESACPTCTLYARVQYVCLNQKEAFFGVLSGDNFKASSFLPSTVIASTCHAQWAEAGDQYTPPKGDHFLTSAVEGWRPASCDKDSSWLQVDLGSQYAVGWYSISGCRRLDYWTTKFAISYSLDGVSYTMVRDASGEPKKFDANEDAINAKVCTLFQYNIAARYMRIHPLEYHDFPCAHIDFGHNATFAGCPVTTVANSNLASGGSAGFGTSLVVNCNAGWATNRAETSYTMKCGADGKWAADFRDCSQLLYCPDMPIIDGGYATGPSTLPGARITYQCNAGRTLRGATSATCRPDGTWSNPAPVCETQ